MYVYVLCFVDYICYMTNKLALLLMAVMPVAVCTIIVIWQYLSACDILLTILGAESRLTSSRPKSTNIGLEMRRTLTKDELRRISRSNSVISVVSRMTVEARRQLYFLVATPLTSLVHTMPLYVLLVLWLLGVHPNLDTAVASIVCFASQSITRAIRLILSHPELLDVCRKQLRRDSFTGPISVYSAQGVLDLPRVPVSGSSGGAAAPLVVEADTISPFMHSTGAGEATADAETDAASERAAEAETEAATAAEAEGVAEAEAEEVPNMSYAV